jgi:hypothetical protein
VLSPWRVAITHASIELPLLFVTAGGSLFVELPEAAVDRRRLSALPVSALIAYSVAEYCSDADDDSAKAGTALAA